MGTNSTAMKNKWQDPTYRERVRASIRKSWRSKKRQQQHRDALKRYWKDNYFEHCEIYRQTFAKLTEEQARNIRDDARPLNDIAEEYGVTRGTVKRIKDRKIWKFPDDCQMAANGID